MRGRSLFRVLPLYLGVASTGVVAIVSIPVMIASGGLNLWAHVGVGQSVGAVASAVVSYGWAVTGPAAIAESTPALRRREYLESVKLRLLIAPLALVLAIFITVSVTGPAGLAAGAAGVLSTGLTGLSAIFYFLGTGQLWQSFLLDSLPRALGTLLGIVLLLVLPASTSMLVVPLLTGAGALAALAASSAWVLRNLALAARLPTRGVWLLLVQQRHGLLSSVSTASFQMLPTVVVGWLAPSLLGTYVFYDRIFKQAMTFLSPALNVFQGWVPRASGVARRNRMRLAVLVAISGGAATLILLALLGDRVVDVMSSGAVPHDLIALLATGAMIALSAIDLIISRVGLVIRGRLSALAGASVLGLVAGLTLVVILTPAMGLVGALLGTVGGVVTRLAIALGFFFAPDKQ